MDLWKNNLYEVSTRICVHISTRSVRHNLAHKGMMDQNWWTHLLHGYNTFLSIKGLAHLTNTPRNSCTMVGCTSRALS
jgi:hypothetical protein